MTTIFQYDFAGAGADLKWDTMIADLFGAYESVVAQRPRFRGRIGYCDIGRVSLSQVVSSFEYSRRTEKHVGKDSRDTYVLVNVKRGSICLRQGGKQVNLSPGTFAFYYPSHPFEWSHSEAADVRNIAIPGSLLRSRLRNLNQYTMRPFTETAGMWAIMSDMMDSSFRQASTLPDGSSFRLATQLVDLLALSLETEDNLTFGDLSARNAVYRRCLSFICSHIRDEDLNPEMIASALGLSVRSLHRLFGENGTTVSDCIRNERLERSYRELQDPSNRAVSIAEIAYRCGFRRQTHFAAAFKSKYGMTASALRRHDN